MKWSDIRVTHSRSMYLPKSGRETVAIRKYISLAAGIEKRKKDFLKLQESPTYSAQANSVLRRHEGQCEKIHTETPLVSKSHCFPSAIQNIRTVDRTTMAGPHTSLLLLVVLVLACTTCTCTTCASICTWSW